jgi:hypothetical protein
MPRLLRRRSGLLTRPAGSACSRQARVCPGSDRRSNSRLASPPPAARAAGLGALVGRAIVSSVAGVAISLVLASAASRSPRGRGLDRKRQSTKGKADLREKPMPIGVTIGERPKRQAFASRSNASGFAGSFGGRASRSTRQPSTTRPPRPTSPRTTARGNASARLDESPGPRKKSRRRARRRRNAPRITITSSWLRCAGLTSPAGSGSFFETPSPARRPTGTR